MASRKDSPTSSGTTSLTSCCAAISTCTCPRRKKYLRAGSKVTAKPLECIDSVTTMPLKRAAGSGYLVGHALSAADIHLAAGLALFRPLPHDVCAMKPDTRAAFETPDARTDAALDPVLLAHRDRIYREHLELPLAL